MDNQNNGRIFAAELVGTGVLMLGGPGVAIFTADQVGVFGVAAGFGLSLLIMAYVIGPISGCHINPAVTLGMLLARKIDTGHAVFAWLGQLFGGIVGGAMIYGIASGRSGFAKGSFASNLWTGDFYGFGSMVIVEVLLTALLVLVVLFTTTKSFAPGFGGLVIGLTLMVIHLISIPVDNTSVNPARSIGTAVWATTSSHALEQVWAFIVFPLLGSALGVVLFLMLDASRLEDTMLAEVPGLARSRDVLDKVAQAGVTAVDDTVTDHGDDAAD
jgi:aquaporin Z